MIFPKHFKPQEYLPPHIYQKYGTAGLWFIDSRVIVINDMLREKFGPIIMNTWHSPKLQEAYGNHRWRGLRTPEYYRESGDDDLTMFRKYNDSMSQHKFGRAADDIFQDVTADEVREYILNNKDEFFFITAIELGVSWLHFDCRNCDKIFTFSK